MFSQVEIDSFGSFTGHSWRKSLKDAGNTVQNFKRLNILYGRNYSGKTTLSWIFRALETGRIPQSYMDPKVTIRSDKGDVTQAGLAGHSYDIWVYNRDFLSDNLSFLVNQTEGEIKTFAIVGEKNKEIEDAIIAIQTKLGSVETKVGLRHELEAEKKERDRTKGNYKTASDAQRANFVLMPTVRLSRTVTNSVSKKAEFISIVEVIRNVFPPPICKLCFVRSEEPDMITFHQLTATSLGGQLISMADYAGKLVLVVNTASHCGFTPQYAGLEALYKKYAAQGLVVLGFPCNQFGKQEPGGADEIAQTCHINYGVSFPIFEKVEVNGAATHPVFSYLKNELPGVLGGRIKWNFTKFLIGRDGKPLKRFAPFTTPEKMEAVILAALISVIYPTTWSI